MREAKAKNNLLAIDTMMLMPQHSKNLCSSIDLDSEEQGEGEGGEHHQQGHEGQQAGAQARALLARRR